MRSDEERIACMHKRAQELESRKTGIQEKVVYIGAAVAAAILMFIIVTGVPGLSGSGNIDIEEIGASGSMFSGSTVLDYIVVGVCAFILGVAFTVFCYSFNKYKKSKKGDEK